MRYRLTLVLAAALIALVASNRSGTAPQEVATADNQSASLLAPVPANHWAYPALDQLDGGKSSISVGGGPNGAKPVTRFEMAVLLARIMEKLEGAGAGKLPADKMALLEKLTTEFRGDLDSIGADMNAVKTKLDELAKRVEEKSGPTSGALVKQVFDTNQKLDAVQGSVQALTSKLANQNEQLAETQKKTKVYAEVLAKLLMKVARLEKSPQGNGGLSRQNLNDLRGLIKEFVVDFETRLTHVEAAAGTKAVVPAATRLPVPSTPRRVKTDPDHILDGQPADEAELLGPASEPVERRQVRPMPDDKV